MKAISLFSGPGLLDLGFHQAGWDIVASNELDGVRCETLRANFGDRVINTSVHQLSVEDLWSQYGRDIDAVIGGFPCKTYSKAANIHDCRAGVKLTALRLNHTEKIPTYSRYAELGGDLFLHFWRIASILQPRVIVVENVPGILGANIVRETFRHTPCNDRENGMGYYYTLFEGVLDARNFGLPQRRPRYFFIAARKDLEAPAFERPAKRRQLVEGDVLEVDPDVYVPDYVAKRLAGGYRDRPIVTVAGPDAIAPTCVSHYAKDRSTRLIKIGDKPERPYSVTEWRRLQGVPDDYKMAGIDTDVYDQVGDGVAVPVAYAVARAVGRLIN